MGEDRKNHKGSGQQRSRSRSAERNEGSRERSGRSRERSGRSRERSGHGKRERQSQKKLISEAPAATKRSAAPAQKATAPGVPLKIPSWKPTTLAGWIEVVILMWLSAFPVLVFVMTFSKFGYGAETHEYLREKAWTRQYFVGFAMFTAVLLYLLDASYWEGKMLVVKKLMILFIVGGLCMGCLAAAKDYPSAPMCLYVLGSAMYFIVLRKSLFYRLHGTQYFGYLAIAMTMVGFLCCLGFIDWTNKDDGANYWPGENGQLKREYNMDMDCDCRGFNVTASNGTVFDCIVSEESLFETCCENVECIAGYLLWFSPFVAGFVCIIFGALSYYMAKTITAKTVLHPGVKMFASLCMVLVIGMWVAASVASTDGQMANMVFMFAFACLALMAAFIVSVVGYHALIEMFMQIPLVKRLHESLFSDWIRAIFMLTGLPLFLMYLAVSVVNQFFRKKLSFAKTVESDEEKRHSLTLVAHNQLQIMKNWQWSSVLVKSMYLCMGFLMVSVGISKLTTLFLAWLNVQLAPMAFSSICGIFFIVGVVMFLLPPVPGVPVYITGGVVLVAAAWPDRMDFATALFFTSVFCFMIKLIAIVCQQKGIGGQMADKVWIRRMVGTNSVSIQAIRLILEKPGISMAKVSILCGGPDWPTSVLTGILKLPLGSMLLGSMPVFFLIAPCCCAGAFMLRVNEPGPWSSLAPVVASVAALVQTVVMFAALYFIEQTASEHHELLLQRCNDVEVQKLDDIAAEKQAKYREVTDWHKETFPKWLKINLIFGFCCCCASCWFIQMFGSECFEAFDLTDTIEERLDGKASNLVLTKGWNAIGLFCVGMINLVIFNKWAKKKVKALEAESAAV